MNFCGRSASSMRALEAERPQEVLGRRNEVLGFRIDKNSGRNQFDCARQPRAGRHSRTLIVESTEGLIARKGVVCLPLLMSADTAASFLFLLIIAAITLGLPLILIVIRLIQIISEARYERARRSEEESSAEVDSAKDAEDWTPAKHMR